MNKKNIVKHIACFSCLLLLTALPVFAGLPNPLSSGTSKPVGLPEIIGRVIKGLLGIIGIVALLYFIIGGFYYLTSAGNPEKVKKGTGTITWAVVGMVIAFGSYAIVTFILGAIGAT